MKTTPAVPWYWVTRALGVIAFVYGLGFDHSGDRSTIIVAACGLLGLDKVARSEPGKK